jgi:hypothetical protein
MVRLKLCVGSSGRTAALDEGFENRCSDTARSYAYWFLVIQVQAKKRIAEMGRLIAGYEKKND